MRYLLWISCSGEESSGEEGSIEGEQSAQSDRIENDPDPNFDGSLTIGGERRVLGVRMVTVKQKDGVGGSNDDAAAQWSQNSSVTEEES
jgi:hypothetical protein